MEVGDTHVTFREPSGRVRVAAILEKRLGPDGKPETLLLDRVAHEKYVQFDGWEAAGCFVTELMRSAPVGAGDA